MTANAPAQKPEKWQMKIGKSVYGPYSREEMEGLAEQGLLAPHSRVAKHGSQSWARASSDPVINTIFCKKFTHDRHEESGANQSTENQPTNFALFLDVASNSNIDLFQAIQNLGPSSRISGTCWLVKSDRSAGDIRNALAPLMAQSDRLLVIDTAKSKVAWFNLGPEADAKIRKVWD